MTDKIVNKYFPELTPEQQHKFAELGEIYKNWNAKINLISRKDMDHFYERHVLHSLGIAKVCQFKHGTQILDVGTGGGFPGIPLAILLSDVQFHLIDSTGKKIKVVEEIADVLKITNVTTEKIRAEDVTGKYDFVVSRAVKRMKPFYEWVKNKIKPGGSILYLKGGDINEEMKELKKAYQVYYLKEYFAEDFFETKKVVYVEV